MQRLTWAPSQELIHDEGLHHIRHGIEFLDHRPGIGKRGRRLPFGKLPRSSVIKRRKEGIVSFLGCLALVEPLSPPDAVPPRQLSREYGIVLVVDIAVRY